MPDKPRIGYVVKRYPRFSETFIVNEILAHEAAGYELAIFSVRPCCDTHFQDVISKVRSPVYYVPYSGVPKATSLWRRLNDVAREYPHILPEISAWTEQEVDLAMQSFDLAKLASKAGVTHLHAHFATAAASTTRLTARMLKLPFTFTTHAKDIFHQDVDPANMQALIDEAASVITVSDYNVQHLNGAYATAGKVQRLYNGIDLARFPYAEPADRPPLIVSVGRLVKKKGFDVLIDACALLKADGLDFRCEIIGTGDLEKPLKSQIKQLGVGDVVSLVGPRPQAALRELLHGAAGFAAPCVVSDDGDRDGLPTVLLESMSLGTPCVATDVTGIPEILRTDETGILIGQHDPRALADGMRRLITDPDYRVRVSRNARDLIEREFDIDRNAAKQRAIFGIDS